MIADLNPYAEYKDSGSCWLANVPLQWKLQNLRVPIRSRNERNRPDLPLLSVAREKGLFVRSLTDADENHNVITEDLSNYKVVRAGNFVVNKMKSWQGSMGIAPVDGIVSPAYFVYDFAMYSGDLRGSSSREGRSSSRRCRSSRSFWTRSRPRGGRTFAIVIDEVHSSQGGKTSAAMSQALGAAVEVDGPDPEDTVNAALEKRMAARKMLTNASY